MVLIHPTAVIDPTAQLGENVQIGPYSVIGAGVEIGDNTIISSSVRIEDRTIVGSSCQVSPGAVLGGAPQDLSYKNEPTRARIGNNNIIRECVTINRASGEGNETVVGNNCFLMAYSHLGHNGKLANNVILANAVQLGGYVELDDYVFIGGGSVIHQFVKVGRMAFMAGASASRMDLPPFSMNDSRPCMVIGINTVGLKRRGLSSEDRQLIKKAFYYLWFSGLNQAHAIEAVRENMEINPYIEELLNFVSTSKRGINPPRKHGNIQMAEDAEKAEEEILTV